MTRDEMKAEVEMYDRALAEDPDDQWMTQERDKLKAQLAAYEAKPRERFFTDRSRKNKCS